MSARRESEYDRAERLLDYTPRTLDEALDVLAAEAPVCGDGVSAPCGKKPGHKGRHIFENEHVSMSWKNLG